MSFRNVLVLASAGLMSLSAFAGKGEIGNGRHSPSEYEGGSAQKAGQRVNIPSSVSYETSTDSVLEGDDWTTSVTVKFPALDLRNGTEVIEDCSGSLTSDDLQESRIHPDFCTVTKIDTNTYRFDYKNRFASKTVTRTYYLSEISWKVRGMPFSPANDSWFLGHASPSVMVRGSVENSTFAPLRNGFSPVARNTVRRGESFVFNTEVETAYPILAATVGFKIESVAARGLVDGLVQALPAEGSDWILRSEQSCRDGKCRLSIHMQVPTSYARTNSVRITKVMLLNEALQEVIYPVNENNVLEVTPKAVVGPLPAIEPSQGILAELHTAGGLAPVPISHGIRIMADGSVLSYNGQDSVLIATIKAERLERLRRRIDSLTEGKLQDQQEGQPVCADVPTTTFSAFKSDGTKIEVVVLANCHTYERQPNDFPELRAILDGFRELAGTISSESSG